MRTICPQSGTLVSLCRVEVFRRLIGAGMAAAALAACSGGGTPSAKWTVWYIPNEPRIGTTLSKLCHTFVFSNPPEAKEFRVAVIKHIVGNGISEDHAYMQAGDTFTGAFDLGPATIHDENTGYDVNVDVVYKINTYVAAKARADADCPPLKSAAHTSPSAQPGNPPSSAASPRAASPKPTRT